MNVAVQVMPPSLLASGLSVPPTSATSALLKPVTASLKVIVTAELLSVSLSAASVMTTAAVGPTMSAEPIRLRTEIFSTCEIFRLIVWNVKVAGLV